jgi:ketosteroid isomerase-like protein
MPNASQLVGRTSSLFVAIALVAFLGACQDEEQPAVDPSAFRAEIDQLRSEYEAAVAEGATDAMAAVLADGAVMVRPGGPDWDAMAAAASGAPFPPGAKITITPIEVVALSKEWAYEFGTAVTTYTLDGADKEQRLRDTYLILLRNTGDGWKAYREVASSSPPPGGWPTD